jgi:Tfp pilus assembly protein FimT
MEMPSSGFTLIEILVVCGIIVILVAMLFPVIMGIREKARRMNCASNLSQIGKAVKNFAKDHENLIPTQDMGPNNMQGWSGVPGRLLAAGYLDEEGVFKCPSSLDKPVFDNVTERIMNSSYAYNRMPARIGVRRDFTAIAADEDCIPQGSQGQVITPNHHYKGANVLFGNLSVLWYDAEDGVNNGVVIENKTPEFRAWKGDSIDYLWKFEGTGRRNKTDNYLIKGKGDPATGGFTYREIIE